MSEPGSTPTLRLFISYSRRDIDFVQRLETALAALDVELSVDRTGIEPLEDWWERIETLIAASDTVLFVLSPNSVASDVCRKEVAFAERLNKRLAPVVAQRVDNQRVPPSLKRLNYVHLDDESTYETQIERLVQALRTDLVWVRQHSVLGAAAHRWAGTGRPRGLLLSGTQLEEAERWIATRPSDAPVPTDDVQGLIVASRRAVTRRRNVVIGALSFGLVVATILGGLALWQRQVAIERERQATEAGDRARRSLASAKEASDVLIFDIGHGLLGRGLPTATLRTILGRAETLMDRLLAANPDERGLRQSQIATYLRFTDVYSDANDTDRQMRTAERAVALAEDLVAREPESDAVIVLAASQSKLAAAHAATGDLDRALEKAKEALRIRRAFVAARSGSATAERELPASLWEVGDIHVARSEAWEAFPLYEEGLDISQRLSDGAPGDAELLDNLSLGHRRLGEAFRSRKSIAVALEHFTKARDIARRLSDETNPTSQRRLAVDLSNVGSIQLERRHLGDAQIHLDEALSITRRLSEADPTNLQATRDLAVSQDRVADLHSALRDLDREQRYRQGALASFRTLAALNPNNVYANRSVAITLQRLGDLHATRERFTQAFEVFRESLLIRRRLHEARPGNPERLSDLQTAEDRLMLLPFPVLLKRRFPEALRIAEGVGDTLPDLVAPRAARAHGLMFNDRAAEARAIYLGQRGRRANQDHLWEAFVLLQFELFRKEGLRHSLMTEIEALFRRG